jgi:hypothetical protein
MRRQPRRRPTRRPPPRPDASGRAPVGVDRWSHCSDDQGERGHLSQDGAASAAQTVRVPSVPTRSDRPTRSGPRPGRGRWRRTRRRTSARGAGSGSPRTRSRHPAAARGRVPNSRRRRTRRGRGSRWGSGSRWPPRLLSVGTLGGTNSLRRAAGPVLSQMTPPTSWLGRARGPHLTGLSVQTFQGSGSRHPHVASGKTLGRGLVEPDLPGCC